jgi:hypothetical protein
MSGLFLEQRINIKLRAKLGKNASDVGAVFSDAYGGRISYEESQVFVNGINGSKTFARTWKVVKEVVVQDLSEPI